MYIDEFCNLAATNQSLADYLDNLIQSSATTETNLRAVGVDDLLFVVAASALYLLVRNRLDYQRGLNDANLRERMEQEIERFVKQGYSRDKALEAVLAVNTAIKTYPPDDSIIKTALNLVAGSKSATSTDLS